MLFAELHWRATFVFFEDARDIVVILEPDNRHNHLQRQVARLQQFCHAVATAIEDILVDGCLHLGLELHLEIAPRERNIGQQGIDRQILVVVVIDVLHHPQNVLIADIVSFGRLAQHDVRWVDHDVESLLLLAFELAVDVVADGITALLDIEHNRRNRRVGDRAHQLVVVDTEQGYLIGNLEVTDFADLGDKERMGIVAAEQRPGLGNSCNHRLTSSRNPSCSPAA